MDQNHPPGRHQRLLSADDFILCKKGDKDVRKETGLYQLG